MPEVRRHIEAEFPDIMQASHLDRRMLLRLMSASLALGGLAACNGGDAGARAPLLSQSHTMPGYVPGVPVTFATSLALNGYGRGVLVKAQEGRPIKIEGNPLHPASLGATDVFAQAEILSLYDPDRSGAPLEDGAPRSWEEFANFIRPMRNELVVDEGRGLHVLMQPTASPTLHRLIGQARQLFPHAQWHASSPVDDGNRQAAARAVLGRDVDLVYDLTQADAIVTLGGDLFAEEPGHIRYAADYQARRRASDRGLPRLVAIETRTSLVGARADERIPLRPRDLRPSPLRSRRLSRPEFATWFSFHHRLSGRHAAPRRSPLSCRGRPRAARSGSRARPCHQRPSRRLRHDNSRYRARANLRWRGPVAERSGRSDPGRAGLTPPHPRRQSGLCRASRYRSRRARTARAAVPSSWAAPRRDGCRRHLAHP